ncbi:glycosyltransferase family 4 protein [Tropicimonas isoalkanivorans]|uniref:Glycosyltransferase involved in cell wall bisynthesis n=1 Tax=Tropicimonas isoalkanivorans TaxID=441112 RepID=A0A1I1HIT9_9RHOB|nr:glycosyltransferase family 4 protein [Tropicimonas isoalkanivorans]SFC21363.1 Glycosyltransferase involved in cell wall bisynthesis [Tropicimonas isoalkanivorans]
MAPRLRIAVVSHVRHPIAPPFMGGMEAHSWHLAKALKARGHDVALFASGDSDAGVRVHPLMEEHYDRAFPWHDYHGTDTLNRVLDDAFARALDALAEGGFDIVHNNSLHRYPPRLARRDRVPMVTSLHVPPFDALRRAVHASAAPWCRFTVCSDRQRQVWWPDGAPDEAHVVPNGIDLADWPFSPTGDGSAVWAGRITPTKGAHVAVKAARIAGVPLTLFGTIEHRDYFEDEVRPHLGADVRYGGHLSSRDLAAEFGRASALLFTPHWDEPFGLSAIEGMACGLPVAATDMGAVREVIGDCGRYAPPDDPNRLADALLEALSIPRTQPRRRVEKQFTIDRMVGAYEDLYGTAMGLQAAPALPVDFPAIELPPTPEQSIGNGAIGQEPEIPPLDPPVARRVTRVRPIANVSQEIGRRDAVADLPKESA